MSKLWEGYKIETLSQIETTEGSKYKGIHEEDKTNLCFKIQRAGGKNVLQEQMQINEKGK